MKSVTFDHINFFLWIYFFLHFLTAYFKLFMIFPFVIRDVYICINIPLYIFLQIPCPCSPEFCVGMILWKNATHSCYIGYVYLKPCQSSIYAQARLSSGWRKNISIILKLYMILVFTNARPDKHFLCCFVSFLWKLGKSDVFSVLSNLHLFENMITKC